MENVRNKKVKAPKEMITEIVAKELNPQIFDHPIKIEVSIPADQFAKAVLKAIRDRHEEGGPSS